MTSRVRTVCLQGSAPPRSISKPTRIVSIERNMSTYRSKSHTLNDAHQVCFITYFARLSVLLSQRADTSMQTMLRTAVKAKSRDQPHANPTLHAPPPCLIVPQLGLGVGFRIQRFDAEERGGHNESRSSSSCSRWQRWRKVDPVPLAAILDAVSVEFLFAVVNLQAQ